MTDPTPALAAPEAKRQREVVVGYGFWTGAPIIESVDYDEDEQSIASVDTKVKS